MRFREKTRSEAHLDITPIVDTVFNLLIFFALSLNFIVTPGIEVNLPESNTEEIVREHDEVIVMMRRTSEVLVNGTFIHPDQLLSTLTLCAQKNKDSLVIIQADREVAHGNVVKVMDISKRAGFRRLAIATSAAKKTVSEGEG
jgi:biopolymer transport protein ExbD